MEWLILATYYNTYYRRKKRARIQNLPFSSGREGKQVSYIYLKVVFGFSLSASPYYNLPFRLLVRYSIASVSTISFFLVRKEVLLLGLEESLGNTFNWLRIPEWKVIKLVYTIRSWPSRINPERPSPLPTKEFSFLWPIGTSLCDSRSGLA